MDVPERRIMRDLFELQNLHQIGKVAQKLDDASSVGFEKWLEHENG
jgi:hypothetical protein